MKRFRPRHAALLVVLAGLLLAINLAIAPRRRAVQSKNCEINLKQIGLAMMQYSRDYDEKYPIAARWADDLKPYAIGSRKPNPAEAFDKMFHCPTTGSFYAYNANLEKLNMAQTDVKTVWVFEVDAGQTQHNLSDDGDLWPTAPIHEQYPIWANHVLMGDGSVKFIESKPLASAFLPVK